MIATTPFWRKSTTTFLSKWEYPANSLQGNFSGRKIQFATEAHQFATEQGLKSKNNIDKNTMAHKFNIGDKVLISNDFIINRVSWFKSSLLLRIQSDSFTNINS
jgi:hypothetical protein